MKTWLAALLLLPISCLSTAQDGKNTTQTLSPKTKAAFEVQAEAVRAGMAANGRYEFVTDAEHKTVERRLAQMQTFFDAHADATALRDSELVTLLNAQEEINGILLRRDGERLVCTHATPTGSHRAVNSCSRYSEIERARRDTQKLMHDNLAVPHDPRQNCMSGKCEH